MKLVPLFTEYEGLDVQFCSEFFSLAQAAYFFEQLQKEIAFEQKSIVLFGKEVLEPRLTAWYGDVGLSYTYSKMTRVALPWHPLLLELKKVVQQAFPEKQFNSALLNLYRDGNDSNGFHADDEPELGKDPCIVSLSFGSTRSFRFKPRDPSYGTSFSLDLPSGSLLVMQGKTQHFWLHSLPKTKRIVGPRINITFRYVHQ